MLSFLWKGLQDRRREGRVPAGDARGEVRRAGGCNLGGGWLPPHDRSNRWCDYSVLAYCRSAARVTPLPLIPCPRN